MNSGIREETIVTSGAEAEDQVLILSSIQRYNSETGLWTRAADFNIKKTLLMMILGWARDGWMGRGKDVLIDLKITEEDFLPFNVKQVKIQFFDDQTTLLRFYVRKDKIVKKSRTLKQITLQNLSFVVDKPTSVGYLELAIHLAEELEDEI